MRTFAAVVAFSLFTIGFFAGFSNFGIPQIEPSPPPKEEAMNLAAMTMDQFVALGEKIYGGKGTCTLCHNAVGGRAPLLDKMATVAAERLADPRYKGKATNAVEYIRESMVAPSVYVVAGFGKAGSNDTESPMPDVSKGGISLSEAEIAAIIAYLQSVGGVEVTVEIPTVAQNDANVPAQSRAPLATAEEVISHFACGACHKVAKEVGELGPDLTKIGSARDRDYLRRAILDPNADLAEGFELDSMPADFGGQMLASELEMLVDYLASLK
ncbi:MAG: c-type cytochrome [Alphaproteobacteria bacterium]|nr:c-type cytochrome [Alphaproteobacteria bacterium]